MNDQNHVDDESQANAMINEMVVGVDPQGNEAGTVSIELLHELGEAMERAGD